MAFWSKKKAQPAAVCCYGKLTATGDFIRHNNAGAECAAFDHWLSQSINLARESMGESFATHFEPALGVFIYRGEEGDGEPERGLLGVWAASGDSAGRKYPMMVATSYDYEQMLAAGAGVPIAAWP
ncbi:MAG TPA: type VI secretion system-associated protein TagF, partial [Sorangium sp.]|nr:type VI secretion system-associated protein TagF [Sorangium sp.]